MPRLRVPKVVVQLAEQTAEPEQPSSPAPSHQEQNITEANGPIEATGADSDVLPARFAKHLAYGDPKNLRVGRFVHVNTCMNTYMCIYIYMLHTHVQCVYAIA